MRLILQLISWAALTATTVPPMLFLSGRLTLADTKTWMLWATVVWFVVTPLWMDREKEVAKKSS
jgi:hypothetical protein